LWYTPRRARPDTALSYYEHINRVNRGTNKETDKDVEQDLLARGERERAAADGNDEHVLRADEEGAGHAHDRQNY
jgi:hypothetical protein